MLTIEQYISQMKKKDKIDEFNFRNHAENMAAVIRYVMEYFNDYLNPEAYDYENIKLEQSALKIEEEIEADFPESIVFIIEYYKKYKSRIDKVFKNWLKEQDYVHLFYRQDDYEKTVDEFCGSSKMRKTGIEQYRSELVILAREAKKAATAKPTISGFKLLDNSLVDWIMDTYRDFGVNLSDYAYNVAYPYYDEYVEYIYDRHSETSCHINRYNHRYNANPFNINKIYTDNSHRPFINGRKGELEMLIMYKWLFDCVEDTEYWPEYVNLCVTTGRVSLVSNVNVFLPVKCKDIAYPVDVHSTMHFYETFNGTLDSKPDSSYILRLGYKKENDYIWKNPGEFNLIINNLNETFSKYGPPFALELLTPLRSQTYGEDEFFAQYNTLEKGMKKFKSMKIAMVNSSKQSPKFRYLLQTTEDIIRIRTIAKEKKYKLKFAVDISALVKRKHSRYQFDEDFNNLSEIRKAIIGIHLSNSFSRNVGMKIYSREDCRYLNKYDYTEIPDFLSSLSALFSDNQRRYLVPEQISDAEGLEELVDDLLRSGFSFCNQEDS